MSITTNTNKVIKELKKFGDKGIDEIKIATFTAAKDIELEAKSKAPANLGKLRQSILAEKINEDGLAYSIKAGEYYAPYVEFGTGKKVSVPSEMSKIANEIRNKNTKGTFKEGLKAIEDWVQTKNIPKESAYPIFMSILRQGVAPRPFLYPAWVNGRKTYLKDLEKALKRMSNKFNK